MLGRSLVVLGGNDNRIVNLSQYLSLTLAFIYVNLLFWICEISISAVDLFLQHPILALWLF
jgi:hypothetical protein